MASGWPKTCLTYWRGEADSEQSEASTVQTQGGYDMATATQLVTANRLFSQPEPWAHRKSVEHSPYGLPIVDHCANCTLRSDNFFCSLSPESRRDLDARVRIRKAPLSSSRGRARAVYVLCQGRAKLTT